MGKSRTYFEKVAKVDRIETQHLDPSVARKSPIFFSFKNLDTDKNAFKCTSGHGGSLLYIFDTLKLFSQIVRMSLEVSYPNCHAIPNEQIYTHNLHNLVSLSPNGKLHQLGRQRTKERIIGYFDSPISNLFQVCLLDLNHNLSGD